jgi:CheY-like chemotaxis protein
MLVAAPTAGDVLVVEPKAQRREQLRVTLEQLNFGVIASGSVAEAREHLTRTHPAFILVGLRLHQWRDAGWPSEIPMVVLTEGPPTVADQKAAIQFGATLVLEGAAATEASVFGHYLRHGFVGSVADALARRAGTPSRRANSAVTTLRPELHDPATGRLDARLIADALGVQLATLAPVLKADRKAVYRTSDGARLQRALLPLKAVLVRLSEIYPEPAHQRAWLNQPVDDLEGETPLRVILRGDASVIADLLANALVGQPA